MTRVATDEEIAAFDKEFKDFQAKSESVIGEVIRCHLMIEYYLNKCLEVCYPELRKNTDIRLNFSQKIKLLPTWCFGFPWIHKGVVHLNTVRNKVAHNIHYELTETDFEKIGSAVRPLASVSGRKDISGIELVRELSHQASMALFVNSKRLEKASKHGLGAFRLLEEQGYWSQGD